MGIAFATVSAVGQVGVLPAFPLWALIVVAIDLLVIYQLTAHWRPRIDHVGGDCAPLRDGRTLSARPSSPSGSWSQ